MWFTIQRYFLIVCIPDVVYDSVVLSDSCIPDVVRGSAVLSDSCIPEVVHDSAVLSDSCIPDVCVRFIGTF